MRLTACPAPYSGLWVDHLTWWRRLLGTGVYTTVGELTTPDKTNASYISLVLQLTLPTPKIVEATLDGRQPAGHAAGGGGVEREGVEPPLGASYFKRLSRR